MFCLHRQLMRRIGAGINSMQRMVRCYATVKRIPVITLNDGYAMPEIGFGTWQANAGDVGAAVRLALKYGYRHFDCATMNDNEREIGAAIKEHIDSSPTQRSELFVTTKLWNTCHELEKVVPQCRNALQRFGLHYLDLYLMHWPCAQKDTGKLNPEFPFKDAVELDYDYLKTWQGMEKCVELKLTRSIGVANFNSKQLQRLLDNCKIPPVTNQVEVSPHFNQKNLIKFCMDRKVVVTANSPLGSPGRPWAKPSDAMFAFEDANLFDIAVKHRKTVSQVILRYVIQLGCVPLPRATNPKRIEENLNIFNFALSDQDMDVIGQMQGKTRVLRANELRHFKEYPFREAEL